MPRYCPLFALLVGLLLLAVPGGLARAAKPSPEDLEFFEKQVRPLLASRCFKCHGPKEHEGGLRLDSRKNVLTGGDTGPAIIPGDPAKSLLVEAIGYDPDGYQMPPAGKLPEAEIAVLTRWVKLGAPWPETPGENVGSVVKDFNLAERAKHWSFQPIRNPKLPAVQQQDWAQSPADRFILSRLESAGLQPASKAERATLLRRVYFDLIGLPPTPAEVEEFLSFETPEAYERAVDRLLDSPHFGERWGRHWLDLVRYAESRGHEFDYDAPNAWQYRDYVIRALNADVPYDKFLTEHLAGDLVPQPRLHPTAGYNESILGTGFWFLGEWVHSPVDIRQDELERADNQIDVLTKTFMGLTVACARCHDHKFDAITAKDYYALAGFVKSSSYRQVRFETLEHNTKVAEQLARLRQEMRQPILQVVAQRLTPGIEQTGAYLLAARDVMQLALPDDKREAAIQQTAKDRSLDAARLTAWIDEIERAEKDPAHVLHPWSLACRPGAGAGVVDELAKQYAGRERFATPNNSHPVIDYADLPGRGSRQWIADGFTFGLGPQTLGTPIYADDPNWPVAGLVTEAGAHRDPAFRDLKLSPGTQKEPGTLNQIIRAGRTLRTPTFLLEQPRVSVLVRGGGQILGVVGSHYMIKGPLHGKLVHRFNYDDKYRWITISLDDYVGRQLHLEFTPRDEQDSTVLKVVQGDESPRQPAAIPPQSLLSLAGKSLSPEDLAKAYQSLFGRVRAALDDANAIHQDEAARIGDFLLRHRELFLPAGETGIANVAADRLKQLAALEAQVRKESATAMAILDGNAVNERLLIRGNHKTAADPVPRRLLEAIDAQPIDTGNSGRLELAQKLVSGKNPFVARVIVNRVWHHLFGRGLVPSTDNFGVLGQEPSHPELLDYLAVRFVDEHRWSLKALIRELVLSSTYGMSSAINAKAEQADPTNQLWHRMPVRRLQGEVIRDAVLAISGRLDKTLYGPGIPVHLTPFMQGRGRPKSGPVDGAGRRSIYLGIRRNFLSPFLLAFDTPIPFTTRGQRTVSNVPAQALILMNDPMVVEQSQQFARRVISGIPKVQDRIETMYLAALARQPTDEEMRDAEAFIEQQAAAYGLSGEGAKHDLRAWADLAHVLFNVKEFIFIR